MTLRAPGPEGATLRRITRIAAVPLLLLAGCTSGQRAGAERITADELPPCTIPGDEDDVGAWHEVEADGFVFCVPAEWRASGSHRWLGGAGWIEWGTGEYRPRVIARRTEVSRVPADTPPPPPLPRTRGSRRMEVIDGSRAELWLNDFEGQYYTGATWSSPDPIHLTGETRLSSSADLHLRIYRTVRFRVH